MLLIDRRRIEVVDESRSAVRDQGYLLARPVVADRLAGCIEASRRTIADPAGRSGSGAQVG